MLKWVWTTIAAVAAALTTLMTDAGVHAWNALASAGLVSSPACSDVVVFDGGPLLPMCVRSTSLVLVVTATAVTAAVLSGVVAHHLAR